MVTAVLGFIIGAVLGSFAKAAAERLSGGRSLRGRSHCQSCKHKLAWCDLFPVLSYLSLRGRCRYCKKQIPVGDFLTEVVLGIAVAAVFYITLSPNTGLIITPNINTIFLVTKIFFQLFVLVILTIVFWTDNKTGLILDKVTYPASIFALFYLIADSTSRSILFYVNLKSSLLGQYLMMPGMTYVQSRIYRFFEPTLWALGSAIGLSAVFALLIIITRGKGMGWGDVKYVFFLGLVLGFPGALAAVFLSFIMGALFALVLMVLKKKTIKETIPFGPFLSLGAGLILLFGKEIMSLYPRLI
ncbi:MAG: putative type IV leader peptidase/N-methyltransferase [Candidatus Daviesbacteria bacterium GW2011_GWB1_41_5]|uniref:Putative type IV leader peptidase/N-methyltransferase n=1 Tax=Candidatus Daviesbacteria bacterium GW2011_GWB1_41_5 TaxID=1618429 RepID=A0A0G0WIB0_9BACT|nr:MAG: putative type IV leader peptidase/N-methyltransferase [Candidatus Daviesbacteria bacterium GW2011_GWB1_41_5]